MKNNEELLREIASQLSNPRGDKGIEIADMMHETNIGMTRHAIQSLQIKALDNVLELGHGNCKHLSELFAQDNTINYFGLEISELMHEEAVASNANLYPSQVFFRLYDGRHIPFQDSFFSKIFTVNTLYFWTEPTPMFDEICRVMKPDGIFSLTFAHKTFMETLPFTKWNFHLYDLVEIKELVSKSSLKYISEDTKVEQIKSKTDEYINRTFTTITLTK